MRVGEFIKTILPNFSEMAFDRTFEIVNSQSQQLIIAIGDDILTYQPPTILVSLLPSLEEGSFKLVASLCYTDGIEYHCAPPNISELFTRSEQVHSYSTHFSITGRFYIKQVRTKHELLSFSRVGVKIWNGIPPELHKLRKAPFKCKLTHPLLKMLETEEKNVDMCYNDLSSLYLYFN